jgi:hypothetical protein
MVGILVFWGFLVLCLIIFWFMGHQTMDKVQKYASTEEKLPWKDPQTLMRVSTMCCGYESKKQCVWLWTGGYELSSLGQVGQNKAARRTRSV